MGKTQMILDDETHALLRRMSKDMGRSMSSITCDAIWAFVRKEEANDKSVAPKWFRTMVQLLDAGYEESAAFILMQLADKQGLILREREVLKARRSLRKYCRDTTKRKKLEQARLEREMRDQELERLKKLKKLKKMVT